MKRFILIIAGLFLISNVYGGDALVHQGDKIVGGRLALGSVYGASAGVILSGEYGFKDQLFNLGDLNNTLGFGASLAYSGYSEFGYDYSNYLLLFSGIWHTDIFKNPKLDTYASLSLGYNFASVTIPSGKANRTNSFAGLVVGTALGMRYQLSSQLYGVGEIGFGMGVLRLGIDYRL